MRKNPSGLRRILQRIGKACNTPIHGMGLSLSLYKRIFSRFYKNFTKNRQLATCLPSILGPHSLLVQKIFCEDLRRTGNLQSFHGLLFPRTKQETAITVIGDAIILSKGTGLLVRASPLPSTIYQSPYRRLVELRTYFLQKMQENSNLIVLTFSQVVRQRRIEGRTPPAG